MSTDVADELVFVIGGSVAGTLTRLPNARLRLEYGEAYRERVDPTPLSLSMPVAVRVHADDRRRQPVTNYLWGLLPDNENVLDRWARHYQVSASSPFALLGTPIGQDCAGAVAFCHADDLERVLARPGTVDWLSDAEVAGRLRDLRRDATAWLGRTFTGQFSLAGAQAKTALLYRDGRWGLPSGAMATTHIVKPAVVGLDDHDLNEHLCPRGGPAGRSARGAIMDRDLRGPDRRGRRALRPPRHRRGGRARSPGGPLPGTRHPAGRQVPEPGWSDAWSDRRALPALHASCGCR